MFRISASRVSASHRPSLLHETMFCSHEFPSLHPTRSGPEWCCSTCVPLCEMRLAAHNSTLVSRWPSKRPRKGFPRSRLQSNTFTATRSRRTESGRRPLRQAERGVTKGGGLAVAIRQPSQAVSAGSPGECQLLRGWLQTDHADTMPDAVHRSVLARS